MIRSLQRDELHMVQEVAHATWPSTFAEILTIEQVEYMLNWMYNNQQLVENLDKGHEFYGFFENDKVLGFMEVEASIQVSSVLKIHKLYVLPTLQGSGIGRQLIHQAVACAKIHKNNSVILNVNRFNKAVSFYQKLGFTILKEEDISIGNGYLMEDYVMQLEVKP
jgi:ribosomal protein S18 acetylase RimI-like enzyme